MIFDDNKSSESTPLGSGENSEEVPKRIKLKLKPNNPEANYEAPPSSKDISEGKTIMKGIGLNLKDLNLSTKDLKSDNAGQDGTSDVSEAPTISFMRPGKPPIEVDQPSNGSDANKPMTGAGLNIVKAVNPESAKRIVPLRGLRSVASDAEPLNKLRELSFDCQREIDLAQLLADRKLINENQFNEVVERLQASAKDFGTLVPVSALFELKEIELVNVASILNFLVLETKMPFITLKSFRISNDVFTKLPPDIAERLGVVLFGVVGRSRQVAVLNPIDKGIQRAICDYLGTNDISFFLVRPEDITPVYDKLRSQLADL